VTEGARAIVVTSINPPNRALVELARGSSTRGDRFVVVGDTKSPSDFRLEGCEYYDVDAQRATGLPFASLCPTRHYARKNVGYLVAMRAGATVIIETDDDNVPRPAFFGARRRQAEVASVEGAGWVNVYRYFSTATIWPRGLPLDRIRVEPPPFEDLRARALDCPIQQGLADDNPDVDALYRLTFPLPQVFRSDRRVALGRSSWCPFNSQNTTWWPDAYPLMYLPAHCSFRMTDIWRSFVAQRIAWECGWSVLFHEATVFQERNEHDLMRDFADEVPGYLHNAAIAQTLGALALGTGIREIPENMRRCYRALADLGVVDARELPLLEVWLADVDACAREAASR
jgi:hypothetical protein